MARERESSQGPGRRRRRFPCRALAAPAAVEGRPASLTRWDMTRDATYRSSDSTVVEVDPDGLIRSAGDGTALVHIEAAGREASLEVIVEDAGRHLPMNFANEII